LYVDFKTIMVLDSKQKVTLNDITYETTYDLNDFQDHRLFF